MYYRMFCRRCRQKTLCRDLGCEECRVKEKRCPIVVCTECGDEVHNWDTDGPTEIEIVPVPSRDDRHWFETADKKDVRKRGKNA